MESLFRFSDTFVGAVTEEMVPSGDPEGREAFLQDFIDYLDPLIAVDLLR